MPQAGPPVADRALGRPAYGGKSVRPTTEMSGEGNMKPGKNIAEPRERRTGHVLLLMFVLLATGLVTAGWFFYRNFAQHYRAEVERQLSAIADLKVGELARYRKERLADGSILFQNAPISALVRKRNGRQQTDGMKGRKERGRAGIASQTTPSFRMNSVKAGT